jgi:hypothetical protein
MRISSCEKPDQNSHQSQNSGFFEAQNGAEDAHNGGVEAQIGAIKGLQTSGRKVASLLRSRILIWIRIKVKSRIRIPIKVMRI